MANVVRDPRLHPEAVLGDFVHSSPFRTFSLDDVAFVTAHLRDFRSTCRFSTWLTRIGINSALMVIRKKKSRSEVPNQLGNEEQKWEVWECPDPSPNPEQAYRKRQVLESILVAVSRLPPSQRSVFDLCHGREHSVQACADVVGITVAAAKTRLLRARLTIRSALAERRVCATDACC
jgi:RNA polymerase sigma-70 factor (ECF subfamily)